MKASRSTRAALNFNSPRMTTSEPAPATPMLLFVYGTLRQANGGLMAQRLVTDATYVGDASVPGALYDLDRYPALVDCSEPEARVFGEVYAVRPDRRDDLLALLDQYEGYAADNRYSSLFERVEVPVRYEDGSEQTAWLYRYNHPVNEGRRITSGDWLQRAG